MCNFVFILSRFKKNNMLLLNSPDQMQSRYQKQDIKEKIETNEKLSSLFFKDLSRTNYVKSFNTNTPNAKILYMYKCSRIRISL